MMDTAKVRVPSTTHWVGDVSVGERGAVCCAGADVHVSG
jgi:hypothetical protein